MTTLSNNRTIIDGDIDVGRGQLGFGWRGTASSVALWSLQRGANHYLIDPTANNTTITLPLVGTSSTQAQPGHWLTIANISGSGFNLVVNNSGGTTIATLTPNNSLKIIADSSAATSWVVQYDTTIYTTAATLQSAYNASGATTQIVLSNTFGGLKINDASTALGRLFEIHNNAATYDYFSIGNVTPGSQTPYVSMLGATPGATNSVGIGTIATTSAANGSVALCDSASAYSGYANPNTLYAVFTGGEQHYGGAVKAGTTKTSPNEIDFYYSRNAVTTSGFTVALVGSTSTVVTSSAGSTYALDLKIYGRDATSPSTVSARHVISALVATSTTNVPTVISQSVSTQETAGFTTTPASATLTANATDVLLTLVAPDNVTAPTGAGMDYRVKGTYSVLTE